MTENTDDNNVRQANPNKLNRFHALTAMMLLSLGDDSDPGPQRPPSAPPPWPSMPRVAFDNRPRHDVDSVEVTAAPKRDRSAQRARRKQRAGVKRSRGWS